MNPFMFHNPVRVYFGEGAAKHGLEAELPQVGSRILLAYGGGSIKRNGVYDEIVSLLKQQEKKSSSFPVLRRIRDILRCRHVQSWPWNRRWILCWQWAVAP